VLLGFTANSQVLSVPDSALPVSVDTAVAATDSTTVEDKDAIEDPVVSNGDDSTIFILDNGRRVLQYGNAKVTYQDMVLTADFIDFDMETKIAFARGTYDSLGNATGRPVFKQGSEEYTMDSMYFNFDTKKAKIYTVITQQSDGYLHGSAIKRMPDNTIYVQSGKYTTCDLEHPHFYLALTKAKVVPNDKVVTGPAWLVLADVPMPLIIPFGLFPQSTGRSSGVIIPSYGEENSRGFFFRDGGYYFAFNDYFDIALSGDIYTLGTWRVGAVSNYAWRYKIRGSFNLNIADNVIGELGSADYSNTRAYSLQWSHQQDPKMSPNKNFSASVNFVNTSYRNNNQTTVQEALVNTTHSSVSYSQQWPGTPFSMSVAATHSHSTVDSIITLGLPTMSFNMSRIMPFKRSERVGPERWYEKIGLPLSVSLQNTISAKEYEFSDWNKIARERMKNGLTYNTNLSVPFTVAKFINLTPSVSYKGWLYLSGVEQNWVADTFAEGGHVQRNTVYGLKHDYDFSTSLSASTMLYGMYQFGAKFPVQAIRHVITPSVSLSWRPDFSEPLWGMYQSVQTDTLGNTMRYSPHQSGIYSTASRGKNTSLGFGLNNTLEMKVRSKSDTVNGGVKKIKILEGLSFNSGYNFLADSMRLSPISFSGRTTLPGNLGISFSGVLNPYALNENGNVINRWQYKDKGLVRLTSFNFSFGYSFNQTAAYKHEQLYGALPMLDPSGEYDGMRFAYVDFSAPWTFSFNYSFSYSKPGNIMKTMQTLNFNGDISLTQNWKVSATSGWDFDANKLTTTSVSIHRDLHCWVFDFTWTPIGSWKSWTFGIHVNSSLLKDLKYDKRQSRYDQQPI
jgi:hypothetical protein